MILRGYQFSTRLFSISVAPDVYNRQAYAGSKAPVEHYTRAAAKEFGARGISVTAVGPGPMDTPFFYPAEGADAVAYHKTAAALSPFSKTCLLYTSRCV